MKRVILSIGLVALVAASALAQAPRTPQVSADQMAPATTVYDTTYTTASAQIDTLWLGFYSNWVTVDVLDADITMHFIQEDPSMQGAAADTLVWWPNSRGKNLRRIPHHYFTVKASGSVAVPVRVAAVVVKGGGAATVHVQAGTSGYPSTYGY